MGADFITGTTLQRAIKVMELVVVCGGGGTWAFLAATKTAAAVSDGGNCRMGSSAKAWVASAKAQPAVSLTVSLLLRSTPRRCR